MRQTKYIDSAHTPTSDELAGGAAQPATGLPNRLMTAFEVAEFVGWLAGHANITTTQRYMNARANSLAESMRRARELRASRLAKQENESVQVG